ncbi:hypothetical protein PSTT_00245 [Puccinia striiformis]|uniref:Secreted protein n=1 Tax=Puccinia striiformis TaxID=27350 RepID=A0A2S4W816_9BASI|nr:hypothetical protein PSTT_00245 [Puccinia striiformis]
MFIAERVQRSYIIFLAVIALTLLSHVQLSSPPGPQHCTQTFIDNDGNNKANCQNQDGNRFECALVNCHTGGRDTPAKTHPYSGFKFHKCQRVRDGNFYTVAPEIIAELHPNKYSDQGSFVYAFTGGVNHQCNKTSKLPQNYARVWCNSCTLIPVEPDSNFGN